MSLSMYTVSIPSFLHALGNLEEILAKADAFCTARGIDPSVLITYRLAPDMFPLSRQVQIACDIVKGGGARLAGVDVPSFPDVETSFHSLRERVQKTVDFLKTLKPVQIDGSENKTIALKVGGRDMQFLGQPYLLSFVLPNLYFHITTTYAILRHNGVEIGKADYLGSIQ
jgi:uncharacterized protein